MLKGEFSWRFLTLLKLRKTTIGGLSKALEMSRTGLQLSIERETFTLANFFKTAAHFELSPAQLLEELEKVTEVQHQLLVVKEDPEEYITRLQAELNELKKAKS